MIVNKVENYDLEMLMLSDGIYGDCEKKILGKLY